MVAWFSSDGIILLVDYTPTQYIHWIMHLVSHWCISLSHHILCHVHQKTHSLYFLWWYRRKNCYNNSLLDWVVHCYSTWLSPNIAICTACLLAQDVYEYQWQHILLCSPAIPSTWIMIYQKKLILDMLSVQASIILPPSTLLQHQKPTTASFSFLMMSFLDYYGTITLPQNLQNLYFLFLYRRPQYDTPQQH